ncbi:MAG: hypothetical protein KDD69_02470 [Bdellovibrionales bacterium]|nr:hypothetical protein [Bdellovibrionales bacterium]
MDSARIPAFLLRLLWLPVVALPVWYSSTTPVAFADTPAEAADEALVRNTFREYKSAILQARGETAVRQVSSHTIDYYQQMKDLALKGTPAHVHGLKLMDRLMVLSLRHRMTLQQLQDLSAPELFSFAVDQGWIGKESVERLEIGAISINGDAAKGEYIFDGKAAPLHFSFYREQGEWRFDLLPVLNTGNAALEEALKREGTDENEFILSAMESVTGKKPAPTIWDPLLPQ